jgi:hypothetical protein
MLLQPSPHRPILSGGTPATAVTHVLSGLGAGADALSLERSRTTQHTDARDVEYPAPPTFITRVDNPRHALAIP